ncbi:hypothetical protein JR316_0009621 [Psilocybe cubensis]|uniref:F-box domain-containing protein n=2 Tax=Psilocybe cubensis TaxID=181762 RepID=A0A8H8CFK3_PSICU|nr:hypothetical protein JR316_0009621 [Psilocybe cubensis]KAH9477408.1 hypothetical protein JR316_0009621 [Psilocybe cubensis]
MSTCSWLTLPNEMMISIIDILEPEDVHSLSKVDQRTYQACVPALFKKVKLDDYEAIESFIENVPRDYRSYIEELEISTQHATNCMPVLPRVRADTVISLLSSSPRLSKLVMRVSGSLDKSIISPFPYLQNLKSISIANCGDEQRAPLSERLVVSIAINTRNLEELSLDRITRSKMHAPELEGAYPCPPLALNDDDIPDHPVLGSELSLPSLLRIPTLRKLTIRDTHLGHEAWTSIPVACRLQVLDIGSCYHGDDGFNTRCTERIMTAVGPTVDEFSLTAAVSDSVFSEPTATPLARLRKLHITPFFPVDSVVETMANLAGSPVEKISVQCFQEDMVDICSALEKFLSLRVERGPEFYHKLKQIDVSVTNNADEDEDDDTPTDKETQERLEATKRLQDFCRDLQLRSIVAKEVTKKDFKPSVVATTAPTSFVDARRYHVKGRSMSI